MLEMFFLVNRTSAADATFVFFYALALARKAESEFFLAIFVCGTASADAQFDCFFFIHKTPQLVL
jgi:hypothetical protein